MRRVRANLERILERLPTLGFTFGWSDKRRTAGQSEPIATRREPNADSFAMIELLERRFGPLPLAVRAWIAEVGSFNLIGDCPGWPTLADPFVVDFEGRTFGVRQSSEVHGPLDLSWVDARWNEWCEYRAEEGEWVFFELNFAPDAGFKINANSSGGYYVPLPDPTADGVAITDSFCGPFTDYLRDVVKWGGFPGFADKPELHSEVIAELTRDLLPF